MKKSMILAAILFLALAGCPDKPAAVKESGVTNIDAPKAFQMTQDAKSKGSLVVLDVRTPGEFSDGHIAGAINLNVNSPDFVSGLEKLDRDKTYLVYCRSGSRSLKAAGIMDGMGFSNVYNLFGGFTDWTSGGLPVAK